MLCCGYTLTDFPISIRLTSLALWQSNDCPSASKATLMNMDKYFMWIHYERLHNHNKTKHNKTVCIFLGIYCMNGVILVESLVNNVTASTTCTKTFYFTFVSHWPCSLIKKSHIYRNKFPRNNRSVGGITFRYVSCALHHCNVHVQASSYTQFVPLVSLWTLT